MVNSKTLVYTSQKEGALMRSVIGTDVSLHFPATSDYRAYERDVHRVQMEHYGRMRAKYGIWAGNQNKFVSDVALLNPLDNDHMEEQYAAFLALTGGLPGKPGSEDASAAWG